MACDCKHNHNGECRRYPMVNIIESGRTAWKFPPADIECAERAATAKKTKAVQVTEQTQNPAPKRATTRQSDKRKAIK